MTRPLLPLGHIQYEIWELEDKLDQLAVEQAGGEKS